MGIEQNGDAAASLSVAEQYVSAFSKLAKESNTILLPSHTGDISSMVTQVALPAAHFHFKPVLGNSSPVWTFLHTHLLSLLLRP